MTITFYVGDTSPATSWTQIGYGASNATTSGNLTRHVNIDWGTLVRQEFGHPKPYGAGWVRTGEAWVDPLIITGEVVSRWAGANAERNLLDEVNDDLPALFNPDGDLWDLRVDRTESGGTTTSRILTVETLEIPQAFNVGDLYIEDATSGWTRWRFTLRAAFPLWRDRTATTQAVSVTNDSATACSGNWTTINNTGFEECGMKFVISAISGTITSMVIANSTNSASATWGDGTALANNDELDFMVDDPQVVDWTDGNTLNAAGNMYLSRGNNDGSFSGTGSGTPSCTVTIHYRFWHKGF